MSEDVFLYNSFIICVCLFHKPTDKTDWYFTDPNKKGQILLNSAPFCIYTDTTTALLTMRNQPERNAATFEDVRNQYVQFCGADEEKTNYKQNITQREIYLCVPATTPVVPFTKPFEVELLYDVVAWGGWD